MFHVLPPVASYLIAIMNSFAGTIEFDLSVSSQVFAQHLSDRHSAEALNYLVPCHCLAHCSDNFFLSCDGCGRARVLRDPARAVSWIEKNYSASSCVQDSPSEEL